MVTKLEVWSFQEEEKPINDEKNVKFLPKLIVPGGIECSTRRNNRQTKRNYFSKNKTKYIKAYSQLDNGNWEEISNNIKSASDEYSKLMTTTNLKEEKQYTTNKIYIMINELKMQQI